MDPGAARRLLDLVPAVPRLGRTRRNSNSMIAWLIETAGLPTGALRPPLHGRAPGWLAGLVVARRAT